MHVFAIAAVSSDGFIAQESSQISTSWTSKEDGRWFNQRTKEAKLVVMGSATFATIGRPLPDRKTIVLSSQSASKLGIDQFGDAVQVMPANPAPVIEWATEQGFSELAVCGGSRVYQLFLSFLETLYLTVEPVKFGSGVPLFASQPDLPAVLAHNFQLTSTRDLNLTGTILQEYHAIAN